MSNWLTNTEAFEFKAQLALFKLSHPIDHFSMFLAIANLCVLLLSTTGTMVFSLLGLNFLLYAVQKYYAVRVYYDVALFEAWGGVNSTSAEGVGLDGLDKELHTQFGIAPCKQSLSVRLLGVRRLLNRQVVVTGLQLLVLTTSLVNYVD